MQGFPWISTFTTRILEETRLFLAKCATAGFMAELVSRMWEQDCSGQSAPIFATFGFLTRLVHGKSYAGTSLSLEKCRKVGFMDGLLGLIKQVPAGTMMRPRRVDWHLDNKAKSWPIDASQSCPRVAPKLPRVAQTCITKNYQDFSQLITPLFVS